MQKSPKKSNSGGSRVANALSFPAKSKGAVPHVPQKKSHSVPSNKELKETLDSFYGTNPEPLLVYDPECLQIIYTNSAFQNLYGYSKKESLQLTVADLQLNNAKENTAKLICSKIQRSVKPQITTHLNSRKQTIKVQLTGGSVQVGAAKCSLIYIKDISAEFKQEEEKKLFLQVNDAIEKGNSFKESLSNALSIVRKFTGFDLGELWLFSPENNYGLIEAFSLIKNRPLLKQFEADSLSMRVTRDQIQGSGIYRSLKPVWIDNLHDQPSMLRSSGATKAGLTSVIILPVLGNDQLIGGVFLFSENERKFDQTLMDILNVAVKRISDEIKHRRTYDQFQSFFQLSGDLLCITDMNGFFKKINPSVSKVLGFSEDELIEQKVINFVHEDDREITEKVTADLIGNIQLKDFSNRFRCKNGEYKWLSWSATYSQDHQLIIAVARDVTKLRIAEMEIRHREAQYRTLSENVPVMIYRLNKDYQFTYVNSAVKETFNLISESFIGKTPVELGMQGERWELLRQKAEQLFQTGIADSFTFKVPSNEVPGKEYNLLINLTPEKNEYGEINSLIAIANEITPIVKAQEELIYKDKLLSVIANVANALLKEENYHTIIPGLLQDLGVATSSDRVYIFENANDKTGELISRQVFEWCSPACISQKGDADLLEIPVSTFADQTEGIAEGTIFCKITSEIQREVLRTLLESLDIRSILIVPIFVSQEFWGFVGLDDCRYPRFWGDMDKDILKTFASSLASAIERKRTAEVIQESEIRFRHMADNAPVMIWVSDHDDNTIYTNKSWADFTGVSLAELAKNSWYALVHPEDMKIAIGEYNIKVKERKPLLLEYRLRTVNGDFRWVIDQALPRFLADGTFLGYIGSVIDIHDRKLSEEKISYQAHVMQEVTEAIISTDLNLNIITWNTGAEKIHGLKADDVIGKPLTEIIAYHYLNETQDDALKHLYNYNYWSGEVRFVRDDRREIYLHSSVSFITNKKGTRIGMVGVNRDITDKRKSEVALRISEERYRSVVDALGEGIILQDQTGKVITSNTSAEKILGLSCEQLRGLNSLDAKWHCIHDDGRPFPGAQHPGMITQQTGKPLQNIIMGVNKPDGTLTWISINTEPLYYSDQRVTPDAVVVSFIDITQKKTAEIELQWNERQLREYSERINNILDSITDGFIAVDNEMKVILWNKVFENSTHIRSIEAMGREVIEIFPDVKGYVYDQFLEALRLKKTIVQEYYSSTHKIWFETTAFPSAQGLFLYFRDISKRKRQESLLALEKEVLELNARPDASLKTTTDFLLLGMEKIFPGILCSVLSLQEDAQTIETLSAPSIPKSYNEAINGLKIGPKIGSCGAAMYHKKNVIVDDIATHEYSELFKELALHYGFASCWSFPILSSHNIVLASFAIYGSEVKSPSAEELLIIERAVNILRLIIESKQSEEKIKVSNERYLLATMATNDAIWDWDIPTNSMYWGEGFHGLFGYKAGYFNSDLGIWEAALHPQDRERVIKGIQKFIESNSQQVWQDEYRFRRTDGKYVLVADRGFLIYNQQGRVNRMVGSMQDITEKREMEKKLLNQELNRQKLTAQAVVDAQEKERSLIGKELHDNINQILSTAKLYLEVARNDDKERTSLIDMSTNSISDAINEIRTISRSLVPSSIGDLGLVESIQDLVESIKLTRKLNVEFYYHNGIDELMSEQLKLMLFRITQEQVNNVIKHANATNLVIELISEDDTINIAITDNGQGFDPDQVKFKKGVGLSNITSRAELFNGKVTIDTAPGKGCTLNIHLPISIL